MTTPPSKRPITLVLAGFVVALTGVGAAIVLSGERDPASDPAHSPDPVAQDTPMPGASAAPSPGASPAPPAVSPSPSPSQQADTPLTDLAMLVPERVAGFTEARNRAAARLAKEPGAQEARRVRYTNADEVEVTHLVALFSSNGTAGAALRQRRAQALERRGARVIDDTGLEDSDGVRRGRLLQVRTRAGDIIVLWRNRNLVGVLGPGRPRLHRRLYDAWPY